jgi:aminoglycoside phosphotransferase (APT) family kinase protein
MREDPAMETHTDVGLRRISGGREADIFDYGDGRVVRLFRPGEGRSREREVAAMTAVRRVVPLVPEVFGIVEIDGRPGIVMQRIDGPDLLARIASKPWTVSSAGRMLGDVHARLHQVEVPPQIGTLRQRVNMMAQSPAIPGGVMPWAMAEFDSLPDGDCLLHGDLHPGNILLAAEGPVVIDWPNVTRGSAGADVARTLLMLRMGEVPEDSPIHVRIGARFVRRLLIRSYLAAYQRHRRLDMASVERWLVLRCVDRLAEGIPQEREKLLAIIERARATSGA